MGRRTPHLVDAAMPGRDHPLLTGREPRDGRLSSDDFLPLSGSKSTLVKPAVASDEFLLLSGSKSHLA
jgi:hypothetical protein